MDVILKPCDVFLTRGNSLLQRAVRVCTRSIGERRTVVNHVGLVVTEGTLRTAEVIEALTTVRWHRLWEKYGPPEKGSFVIHRSTKPWEVEIWKRYGAPRKDLVTVYRPLNLTEQEVDTIVKSAKEEIAKTYDFLKLVAHLLDYLFFGTTFFRSLTEKRPDPICSGLVARAFEKAGKNFGVKSGLAQPDDIWDFIQGNKDKYSLVFPLKQVN